MTEIELCVAEVLARDRVCVLHHDDQVVAFVVVGQDLDEDGPDVDSFVSQCVKKLPSHLVPSKFVQVSEFPMTANGKIDRRMLRSKLLEPKNRRKISVSEKSRLFLQLWQKYLRVPPKGADVFVDVGGDSHLAILLASDLEDATGRFSLLIWRHFISLSKLYPCPKRTLNDPVHLLKVDRSL